jgi:hypothetical protein
VASAAAVGADTTLLVILALYALTRPTSLPVLPLAPAVAASLARVWLAVREYHGCRWARAR